MSTWKVRHMLFVIPALALGFYLGNWTTLTLAADSGDEKVIWLSTWKCLGHTSDIYYTLMPDSISMKTAINKDEKFQKDNWKFLNGKSVSSCPLRGHVMEESGAIQVSPKELKEKYADKVIVLRNGGTIKANLIYVKCLGCENEVFAFAGDDLDLYGTVDLTKELKLKFWNGSNVPACTSKLPNGQQLKAHIFKVTKDNVPAKSAELISKKIIYSD